MQLQGPMPNRVALPPPTADEETNRRSADEIFINLFTCAGPGIAPTAVGPDPLDLGHVSRDHARVRPSRSHSRPRPARRRITVTWPTTRSSATSGQLWTTVDSNTDVVILGMRSSSSSFALISVCRCWGLGDLFFTACAAGTRALYAFDCCSNVLMLILAFGQ